MSKVTVILLFFLVIFFTPQAFAQTLGDCKYGSITQTDPSPIFSDPTKTPSAKFSIDVNNNNDYPTWRMQFDCGVIQNVADATKELDGKNISRTMPNGSNTCEFFAGNHGIKVIAVTPNGNIDQCISHYQVIDSDTQCQLDINPQTGITSATNLTTSGNNLTSGGRFGLFVDEQLIFGPLNAWDTGYVPTDQGPNGSGFEDLKIPTNLLTPGSHQVSLRKSYDKSPAPPFQYRYGSPLCKLAFTVGTPSNPGSIIKTTGGNTSRSAASGPPSVSGGKRTGGCTDDPNHPAIATAIGCIHTNPAEFVKDLLTFLLGIGGGLAFLMMLLGAFQMLTSAGNPETLNAGKERLTSAIIGLLFIIFTILLLQIIGVGILNIPGFK